MDFYKLFDFLVILKETIKLVTKNGKLVLFTTTLSLLFYSILFLIFDFSSSSLMRDMLAKESLIPISSPQTADFINHFSGIKDESPYVRIIYVSFVLSYFFITFLSTVAIILVSSDSYNSNTLSFLTIMKSCTRAFFAGFYTTILVIGYIFLVITMATPVFMSFKFTFSMIDYAILVIMVAYVFYLYLSSVWIMSIVVSVVEKESDGTEALGKSAKIIQGQKWNGFLLNIVFNLASLAVYLCSNVIIGEKYWISDEKITGLVLGNGSCLVKIFTFVAYTVLYYRGKERRSQEIELNSSNFEYAKLGTMPLVIGV